MLAQVHWTRAALEGLVRDARAGAHKYYGVADGHLFAALNTLPLLRRDSGGSAGGGGVGRARSERWAVAAIGDARDPVAGAW